MAIKPLNSVAGFSIGEYPSTTVIDGSANVIANNLTVGNIANLGAISNVKISGGISGQVIVTDGSGTLSFVTINTSSISNGTSSVSIPVADGNINLNAAGNTTLIVTGTGANITGTFNSTGNANVGNLGTAQVLASANVTAPQLISNATTGTAPIVVSSTTLVSNLNADLLDGYNTAVANTASTVVVRDVNGNVSANFFIGDGSQLTGIDTSKISNGNSNVSIPTANGNVNISAAGNANVVVVTDTGVNVAGTLNATGNANIGNIGANTAILTTGNITTINSGLMQNGNSNITIAANGNITLSSTGSPDEVIITSTGVNITGTLNVTSSFSVSSTATFTGGTFNHTGLNSNITASTGNVTATLAGGVTGSGNTKTVNIGTGGAAGSTTAITIGSVNGTTTTINGNANIGNIGANIANLTTANVTGNVIAGGVKTDNLYYANGTPWDLQQAAGSDDEIQYNSGDNFAASANFTYNDTTQLLTVNGNVSAGNFVGRFANGNSGVTIPAANGNVNISAVGNANIVVVTGTGVNVSGTLNASGNANVGNLGTAGLITATGNVSGGNLTTSGQVVATGNVSGGNISTGGALSVTGNANVGNLGTATAIITTGNITTINSGLMQNGNSNVTITANANVTINAAGGARITATSSGANITGTLGVSGNANVSNLGTAQVLASANVTAPQIISNVATGTAPLVVSSTTRVANLNVEYANVADFINVNTLSTGTQYIVFANAVTGNVVEGANSIFVANIANGHLAATLLGGTLTTAAQPNITSVGTLTSLTVSGNVDANNISTTNKVTAGNGLSVTTGTLTVSNGNLDVTGNINVTGNLNYSNVIDLVVGDPLIYIGANNTGNLYDLGIVASYNDGTYEHTGIVRNHNDGYWTFFDGVVAEPTTVIDWANAAYPTVKMGNLLTTANANIGGIANITGNAVVGGTLSVTGNANIGTLNATTAVVTTGNITTINSGLLQNGTSNVSITSGANVTIGVAGTARITATSSGANVNGTLGVSGTANVGNLGTAGLITATGNVSGGNLTTAGVVSATGNVSGGNLTTAGVVSATGNVSGGNLTTAGKVVASTIESNVTTGTSPFVVASTTRVANLNVSYANVSDYINVTAPGTGTGYVVFANATTGNVSEYTSSGISANLSNNAIIATTFVGNVSGNINGILANGNSNVSIPSANGNVNITAVGNTTLVVTGTGANITGTANVSGNLAAGNISATNGNLTTANVSGNIVLGNTTVTWATVTTTAITANQTIAAFSVTGITGIEFLVKGIDATGSKYSVSTVQAVTDGANVDYSTFGGVNLGGFTGTLAVNIVGGQIRLQVTPASSNSTVWTTQYRVI